MHVRMKLQVQSVKMVADHNGDVASEELELSAVYGKDGSANAEWSKYTPCARLTATISNPAVFGQFRPGQFVFATLTEAQKED